MIINLKQDKAKNDIEVIIEYPEMSKTVKRIEAAVRSVDSIVRGLDDNGQILLLKVSDVFYIESVEKRVFIYTTDNVYRSELPLYTLAEKLNYFGFTQISKSCLLNINRLLSVKPVFNSRMEATLANGEKLNISRKYLPDIKKKLEEM